MTDHTAQADPIGLRPAQGSPMASCSGCDARWSAAGAAHCSSCHRTFSGASGFDAHRSYGRCLDPATLAYQRGNRVGEPLYRLEAGIWRSADQRPHDTYPTRQKRSEGALSRP